jgi:hypothetical protein
MKPLTERIAACEAAHPRVMHTHDFFRPSAPKRAAQPVFGSSAAKLTASDALMLADAFGHLATELAFEERVIEDEALAWFAAIADRDWADDLAATINAG